MRTPRDPARLAARIQRRLIVAGALINGVAAFAVAVYLLVIYPPDSDDSWITQTVGLVSVGVYVLLASWLGGLYARRMWRRTRGWLAAGDTPTEKQRKQLLRLPKRLALLAFIIWMVAIPIFGVPPLIDISVEYGLEVMTATLLAAFTASAAVFLVYERILRPAVGLALDPRGAARDALARHRPAAALHVDPLLRRSRWSWSRSSRSGARPTTPSDLDRPDALRRRDGAVRRAAGHEARERRGDAAGALDAQGGRPGPRRRPRRRGDGRRRQRAGAPAGRASTRWSPGCASASSSTTSSGARSGSTSRARRSRASRRSAARRRR